MRILLSLILIGVIATSFGPPNCNLFKEDEACYQACEEAEQAIMHPQGSSASQIHFDKSIALCPTFDYSYYEKGVPYAKRGLNAEWKTLLDKAVELNPKEYLGTRGWYHYLFMKNYKLAIYDIEAYEKLIDGDIGHTGNGRYHLLVIKALSYKGIGERERAAAILSEYLLSPDHEPGLYDYFHLGVLCLELGQLDRAEIMFQNQIEIHDFAEIHYYGGILAKKNIDLNEAKERLNYALSEYLSGKILTVPYTIMMDKVYQKTIEKELELLNG
jgi:tetratricopeptide (TPR) repeat protein